MEDLPKSRKEAISLGLKWYFTGKLCKNGHINKRYVTSKSCVECSDKKYSDNKDIIIKKVIENQKRHPEKYKPIQEKALKKYRLSNKDKLREKAKKYYSLKVKSLKGEEKENFLKKKRITFKKWYKNNPDKVRIKQKNYIERKNKDPLFRINRAVCSGISKSLKGTKQGRHWETLVEFTLQELKEHLEKQFGLEMTWENYGSYWEIDHIKPKSLCSSFEETWKLSNLQPLTCEENNKKGDRYKEDEIEVDF